jgi:hypothetical protein
MIKTGIRLFSGVVALAALAAASDGAQADPGKLAGAWSGGGSVTFGSGAKERAKCRARYSPTSKNSYTVNATCATPAGSVSQTANVRGAGNSYQGRFYNPDYDATGTIYVVVRGRSQTVRIVSNKGSALLRLSR